MKTTSLYSLLFVIAFTGMLASCKKSNSNSSNSPTSSSDLQTNSDDETRVSPNRRCLR